VSDGDGLSQPSICILNASRRCEPSAFLFSRVVHFFLRNGYSIAPEPSEATTILVNTCGVTEDKIATSLEALAIARSHAAGRQIVMFGCLATLPLPDLDLAGVTCVGPKDLDRLDDLFDHQVSIREIAPSKR